MPDTPIRVGIVGLGGWASHSHLPVLAALPQFDVVAVSSRSLDRAQAAAKRHGIPHAVDSTQALVDDPDVDLVAVLTPAPAHAAPARAAIAAGKDVYVEWPLTTTTSESEQLLALADAAGVRHVIGLQRRHGTTTRHAHDLIARGYLGDVRGVRMSIGTGGFGPRRPAAMAWTVEPDNFTTLLSIYGGHFMDLLFHLVGPPADLHAYGRNRFVEVHLDDGTRLLSTDLDDIGVTGSLEHGGLFQIQLEGGQEVDTGLQIDITGTDGRLSLTNPQTLASEAPALFGATVDAPDFVRLPVPAASELPADDRLAAESARELAQLYTAYASDRAEGTTRRSTFRDAVSQHRLIDHITASATPAPA